MNNIILHRQGGQTVYLIRSFPYTVLWRCASTVPLESCGAFILDVILLDPYFQEVASLLLGGEAMTLLPTTARL